MKADLRRCGRFNFKNIHKPEGIRAKWMRDVGHTINV